MTYAITGRGLRVKTKYIYKDKLGSELHVGDIVELSASYVEHPANVGNRRGVVAGLPPEGTENHTFPRVVFEGGMSRHGHYVPDSALVLVSTKVERAEAVAAIFEVALYSSGRDSDMARLKQALRAIGLSEKEIDTAAETVDREPMRKESD